MQYGFNEVLTNADAIYSIVRSLLHPSLRTKALVLELLAALCLVDGGHAIVTDQFDRLQVVCIIF